jgi:hypothetical protein
MFANLFEKVKSNLLLLGPLTVLFVWLVYAQWINPAPFYNNYDPEMSYFYSSLSMLKNYPIAYIDHPGTPLEILGALVLFGTHLIPHFQGVQFFEFHVQYPGVFLNLGRSLIFLFNISAFIFIVNVLRRDRSLRWNLLAISFGLVYFIVHPIAIPALILWSHNSFNYALGTTLLVSLYRVVRRDSLPRRSELILLGAGAGFITSITIYMGTWVVGIGLTFFALSLIRGEGLVQALLNLMIVGASSLVTFVLATLPIASSYPLFLTWVYNLIIHQGRYGSGGVGVVPPTVLVDRLKDLFLETPLLGIGLLFTILMVVGLLFDNKKNKSIKDGNLAFLIAITFQLIFNVFIIAKHPSLIYLLSAAAILPPLIACCLDAWESRKNFGLLATAISFILIILFVYSYSVAVKNHKNGVAGLENEQRTIEEQLEIISHQLGKEGGDLQVLWTYGVHDGCYAHWHGNDYGAGALSPQISRLCPNDGSLNIFNGAVNARGKSMSLDETAWDVIVVREKIFDEHKKALEIKGDYLIKESGLVWTSHELNYGDVLFLVSSGINPKP